jgi:hypothetical protein
VDRPYQDVLTLRKDADRDNRATGKDSAFRNRNGAVGSSLTEDAVVE